MCYNKNLFLIKEINIGKKNILFDSTRSILPGRSDPGAKGEGLLRVISERTDADYYHTAALPDAAAQRPVQHSQAQTRWVQ